ncbi:WhiB family transcriptional regulator [Streptomyces sp. NPDC052496]|uniref:WhiB family transcriptional regulator n=1 Tax=Streptomyces sp. NPDC052496 TaxID=3154951 RepID=UPI00342B711D
MSAFDWMDEALCAQTDPALFHPDRDGSYSTAAKVCGSCPVREQCAQHAERLEGGVSRALRHGLWAGHTPNSRAKQSAPDRKAAA